MHCPFCNTPDTKVIDSRLAEDGRGVRRRRECVVCNARFTTYEAAELVMPHVIKSDANREAYDENKMRAGIERALEKRPISTEQVDLLLQRIKHKLRGSGEREVSSKSIGEMVMDELKQLDRVAYVRFASVYRSFQDVSDFSKEILRLKKEEPDTVSTDENNTR
jgi:transcriptional repressor NrdR